VKIIMLAALAVAPIVSLTPISQTPAGATTMIVLVREAGTNRVVVHPMVCIREFNQPVGPIGDSSGKVVFGGSLPTGTIHLRTMAPSHMPFDTVAAWPPSASASEIRVLLKPKPGPPTEPECQSHDELLSGSRARQQAS
jgi:hypothetical protein